MARRVKHLHDDSVERFGLIFCVIFLFYFSYLFVLFSIIFRGLVLMGKTLIILFYNGILTGVFRHSD